MSIGGFLIAHGSALILPLSVLEGPVVSIVTGFLAAQGCFDWYWALFLLICGDLAGDVVYYWIGRTGRTPLAFLRRRTGLRAAVTPAIQQRLLHNATRMLLIGKWTHSIGCLVLVGSGMLGLPLRRFILVNLLATIPKSALLMGMGYFAGDRYPFLERHYLLGTALACAIGLAAAALALRRTGVAWAGR